MSVNDQGISLEERVSILQAELDKKNANSFSNKLKKIGASILAALTTPEAIKAEKYLAVVALTRALILVPGAAALIDLLIAALGGPSVKP